MQPSTHLHGWVTPRADGNVAKCGGPAACPDCLAEFRAKHGREWAADASIAIGVECSTVDGAMRTIDRLREATRLGVDARATRRG